MTNTCTVDNTLFMLHVAMTYMYKPDLALAFCNSDDHVLKLLYDIHILFERSQFAEGNYLWFKHILGLDSANIDVYGTEIITSMKNYVT